MICTLGINDLRAAELDAGTLKVEVSQRGRPRSAQRTASADVTMLETSIPAKPRTKRSRVAKADTVQPNAVHAPSAAAPSTSGQPRAPPPLPLATAARASTGLSLSAAVAAQDVIELISSDDEADVGAVGDGGGAAPDPEALLQFQIMSMMLKQLNDALRKQLGLKRAPFSTSVQSAVSAYQDHISSRMCAHHLLVFVMLLSS